MESSPERKKTFEKKICPKHGEQIHVGGICIVCARESQTGEDLNILTPKKLKPKEKGIFDKELDIRERQLPRGDRWNAPDSD